MLAATRFYSRLVHTLPSLGSQLRSRQQGFIVGRVLCLLEALSFVAEQQGDVVEPKKQERCLLRNTSAPMSLDTLSDGGSSTLPLSGVGAEEKKESMGFMDDDDVCFDGAPTVDTKVPLTVHNEAKRCLTIEVLCDRQSEASLASRPNAWKYML